MHLKRTCQYPKPTAASAQPPKQSPTRSNLLLVSQPATAESLICRAENLPENVIAVADIRAIQDQHQASRRRLDNLYQSLLHQAFRGEL